MIRSLLALVALAAATLVSGCDQTTPGDPPVAVPVAVSAADDGRTITVKPGATIELTLQNSFGPPGSSLVWDATSSDPSVLFRTSTRVDPAQPSNQMLQGTQRYVADFRAQTAGQAKIIGQGRRSCEAMNPALCQQATYSVTVHVTA